MYYRLKLMRKRSRYIGIRTKGSFLVELLVYTVLAMILLPPVMEMMNHSVNSFFIKRDMSIIHSRYKTAVSMLSSHVFYAGGALPSNPDNFKAVFKNSTKVPFYWGTPVSVAQNGHELRLLYPKSQGVTVEKFDVVTQDTGIYEWILNFLRYILRIPVKEKEKLQVMTLSSMIPANRIISIKDGAPNNIKNILLLPSMYPSRLPFIIRGVESNTRRYAVESVLTSDNLIVPAGAEVYLLYAYRVYCDTTNGIMYAQDYRVNGGQPRIRGIEDICFKFNKINKTLEIFFLIRGNFKYPDAQKISDMDLWPSDVESKSFNYSSHYRRKVYKTVMGVPNIE